jgi:hypothetical protein
MSLEQNEGHARLVATAEHATGPQPKPGPVKSWSTDRQIWRAATSQMTTRAAV